MPENKTVTSKFDSVVWRSAQVGYPSAEVGHPAAEVVYPWPPLLPVASTLQICKCQEDDSIEVAILPIQNEIPSWI